MEYHYRFFADGSCDIICTRCFLKIGKGQELSAAREQAALHVCQAGVVQGGGFSARQSTDHAVRRWLRKLDIQALPAPLFLLIAVTVFYVLPTLLEFAILRHANLWLASILVGDLSGCIGIFVILEKRKLAVLLYLALTALEFWLYSTHIVSAVTLVYLMDLVPTVVMAGAVLRPRARLGLLRS
ncbi:MAG: hypothetical protein ABSF53_19290 [Terracidiphilus sp.]|jgi:hypothetical protein